jgi:O-acetyl-ADP-ribose deacetylase (regulator of RNase III)
MVELELKEDDITTMEVDAIINPSNKTLDCMDGVCGRIHKKAGPELMKACKNLVKEKHPKGLKVGDVEITDGFKLPAKHVIHTVCPIFDSKIDQCTLLDNCFRHSLDKAEEHKLKTLAFPAASSGAYLYPHEACAVTARDVLKDYKFKSLDVVTICEVKEEDMKMFRKITGR